MLLKTDLRSCNTISLFIACYVMAISSPVIYHYTLKIKLFYYQSEGKFRKSIFLNKI